MLRSITNNGYLIDISNFFITKLILGGGTDFIYPNICRDNYLFNIVVHNKYFGLK